MSIELTVDATGLRLDHFLQARLPDFSRSRLQSWIRESRVTLDGAVEVRASTIVKPGQRITVEPLAQPPLRAEPEELPLHVLYLDDDIIAINKPAGMVVHAGAGQHSGTVVNALLHRFGQLSNVSGDDRPGIVHRIDKETSGVLLVARNDAAHRSLASQFADREIEKIYLTLVQGKIEAENGRIETPITRDPVRRIRMTTRTGEGRASLTFWQILERFERFTYLRVKIGTGRTHQIRVHLSSIGNCVAGDRLYGARPGPEDRFFLHAARISFRQPNTGVTVTVEAPLPPELRSWLDGVRNGSIK